MEIAIIVWVVCAIVCAVMAGNRNRSTAVWAIVGLLFGIFGVLAIAVAGDAAA